ncbi:TIGR03571 family LLM class oxidoreductase [Ruegeria lacuscaerulensis]|uniref:TIGR03571 family LLM class oxidoreductase n=1 Tax=Ruegeria lacuscaerulensis TaxID=55218 RepID=UPI00147C01D8|nr:TIGR03571 family LLM class oxidoreductase [Ruegeria lacuscaerulensis]
MLDLPKQQGFPSLNNAYNAVFKSDRLRIGLILPVEAYPVGSAPTMAGHLEIAQLAERLGFSALWLRGVPFDVPSFGDAGQIFDPFAYLGALSAVTQTIALGTAGIVLRLRHPAHVAKAAASADVLSNGRLLLGNASGDRPEEYPALIMSYPERGARFRDGYVYIRDMSKAYPHHHGDHGTLSGNIDMLPKPVAGHIPMLITGGSQQSPDWVAQNGDGWITYPREAESQGRVIADYRSRVRSTSLPNKPVMQSLYIDLLAEPSAQPRPIHLVFRSGSDFLKRYLEEVRALGVNHVALNLRFNQAPIQDTLKRLAEDLLPAFTK